MIAEISDARGKKRKVDFSKPMDISIPLRAGAENVNAFYMPPVKIQPFRAGEFVGDVNQGGSCNVMDIFFNPHGNGTHTECVGHISKERYTINQCLQTFFFFAKLISVKPVREDGDLLIRREQLENALPEEKPEALIIRTIPNGTEKLNFQYSGTNPAYLHAEAALFLRESGIKHLLLDLPSVDREDDGGKLMAHHAFWNYPSATRLDATITELIFVPDEIPDGNYFLNIQIASFENDASPGKPVLYPFID